MITNIIAMILFSFTMSITPGPVNITTFSSGINYGFRPTMPFVSGATIGFTLLLGFVGLGVGGIVAANPVAGKLLSYAGAIFIAYVGYNVMRTRVIVEKGSEKRPLFRHGFIMQWLNGKAWVACLAGVSAFSPDGSYSKLLLFCLIYFVVCYVSIACWALMGRYITKLLKDSMSIMIINNFLGLTLVGLAILILLNSNMIN